MTTSNNPKLTLTSFVRGMSWHDIAKPFALGTEQHAALGYWLLGLGGYSEEALVSLAHGNRSQDGVLKRYFAAHPQSLPAILRFCNTLDRLSASVYSFQTKGEPGSIHSFQNSFSRLLRQAPHLGESFVKSHADLGSVYELKNWQDLSQSLPAPWSTTLTDEARAMAIDLKQPLPTAQPLPAGEEAIRIILRRMSHYPERTYPAVNDTTLTQHCRLSGILAFVVYHNLNGNDGEGWLTTELTATNRTGSLPSPDTLIDRYLMASLVRVHFAGHAQYYEGAARVDDLHGIRELTRKTQQAFKQALAESYDAPALADLLPIHESQFDLIYLLPQEAGQALQSRIHQAYQEATRQVAVEIMARLGRSFPQIQDQTDLLINQLEALSYALRVIAVEQPDNADFNRFATGYGENLLAAYQQSLTYAAYPQLTWADQVIALTELEPGKTCQVTGNYPILEMPETITDTGEQLKWQNALRHAGHMYRSETEKISLICVAWRTLAYGTIAKQMEPLSQPLLVRGASGLWNRVSPEDFPAPPFMHAAAQLNSADDFADMGAFFVRYQREYGQFNPDRLDMFPTTTYAADKNSNVVLLSLKPTEALFQAYDYANALYKSGVTADDLSTTHCLKGPGAWQTDLATWCDYEHWQKTFINYYQAIAGDEAKRHLLPPIQTVQPHLARVMERIARIADFYEQLWQALGDGPKPIRALPLDLDYPALRILLPADRLDDALAVLDKVITKTLFSATYPKCSSQRLLLHSMLKVLVPKLLHGTAILFKQKYALYLALEAERDLFRQLETSEKDELDWYGLRLAFSDLRGSLSGTAPKLAEVTYGELGQVLHLAKELDRRTVMVRGNIVNNLPPERPAEGEQRSERQVLIELANALMIIRGAKQNKAAAVKAVLDDKAEKFKPVAFIKSAVRE